MIRTYLEWILTLPWTRRPRTTSTSTHAREVLDEDHYDLEKVKDRILEYLAVAKLKPELSGPILCFVGPPGVGKTSLGQSIARALGRKFERISVGGVRDEAEIRGHRRTYIGAMPGTIIRALRDAESTNPVLHDRRDRQDGRRLPRRPVERDARGARPGAELDASATTTSTCRSTSRRCCSSAPRTRSTRSRAPLLDRMEVIQLSGYTEDEKLEIAKRYLVPQQLEAHGLEALAARRSPTRRCARSSASTRARPACATSSARSPTVCRKVARAGRRGRGARSVRDRRGAACASGSARAASPARCASARPSPGVATGLAVDAGRRRRALHRGDRVPGQGQADDHRPARRRDAGVGAGGALVGARARRASSASTEDWFAEHDVHIHVPAGAVPRTARRPGSRWRPRSPRWSRGEPVADDVAMTGEITLTGQVLPIGGLKEKALAAQRAGLEADHPPARERARPRGAPAGDARGARVHPRRPIERRARRRVRAGRAARARRRLPSTERQAALPA